MGIPIKIVGGTQPSGTISITENGKHNVARYAIADVNVSGGGSTEYDIECYDDSGTKVSSYVHPVTITDIGGGEMGYSVDTSKSLDKAVVGSFLGANVIGLPEGEMIVYSANKIDDMSEPVFLGVAFFELGDGNIICTMPAQKIYVYKIAGL